MKLKKKKKTLNVTADILKLGERILDCFGMISHRYYIDLMIKASACLTVNLSRGQAKTVRVRVTLSVLARNTATGFQGRVVSWMQGRAAIFRKLRSRPSVKGRSP